MPTPESEMFKAQKPTVPPTFNGVDFDDTKAFKAAEDAVIREQWVGTMMTRLVGEELSKCYIKNGNNHLEKCGELRGKLWDTTLHSADGRHQTANRSVTKQRSTYSSSPPTRSRERNSCNKTTWRRRTRRWTWRPRCTPLTRLPS